MVQAVEGMSSSQQQQNTLFNSTMYACITQLYCNVVCVVLTAAVARGWSADPQTRFIKPKPAGEFQVHFLAQVFRFV